MVPQTLHCNIFDSWYAPHRPLTTTHIDVGCAAQVIDEADRLLAQSFQDWLARVLSATRAPLHPPGSPTDNLSFPHPDAMAPHFFPIPPNRTDIDEKISPSMQKMLFSATLTIDPAKIVAMELRHPKYFVVQSAGRGEGVLSVAMEKFTLPSGLSVISLVSALNRPRVDIRAGTYDLVRAFPETTHALSSSAQPWRHQCAGVHEVDRVDGETREALQILRGRLGQRCQDGPSERKSTAAGDSGILK
jgi:hypothetical protein